VLYLALEDTQRRLQNRLKTLLNPTGPAPERMHIKTELESKKEKSLDDLNGWLSQHPACRLVIIDTVVRIQPPAKSQRRRNMTASSHPIRDLRRVSKSPQQ
jgi:hypothetical protein